METKKIRIPVAVHKNGEWAANRWPKNEDHEAIDFAIEGLAESIEGVSAGDYHIVMVEANVPIPGTASLVVEGKAKALPKAEFGVIFVDNKINRDDKFFKKIIGRKYGQKGEEILDLGPEDGISIHCPELGWFRAWEARFHRFPLDEEPMPYEKLKQQLLEDFKKWTGGSAPNECSQEEIRSYLDEMPDEYICAVEYLWDLHAEKLQ